MRTAKPLLLTTTPIGLSFGLYEASKVGAWLLALMFVLLSIVTAATLITVRQIRLDRVEDSRRQRDT